MAFKSSHLIGFKVYKTDGGEPADPELLQNELLELGGVGEQFVDFLDG